MEFKCMKHFSRGRISGKKNITVKPIQFAVILLIATSLGPSCVEFVSAGEAGTGNGFEVKVVKQLICALVSLHFSWFFFWFFWQLLAVGGGSAAISALPPTPH